MIFVALDHAYFCQFYSDFNMSTHLIYYSLTLIIQCICTFIEYSISFGSLLDFLVLLYTESYSRSQCGLLELSVDISLTKALQIRARLMNFLLEFSSIHIEVKIYSHVFTLNIY